MLLRLWQLGLSCAIPFLDQISSGRIVRCHQGLRAERRLPSASDSLHILNTPNGGAAGIPAFSDAAIASANVARVSSGSITPSSQIRALA